MARYQVIVGNIGTVVNTDDEAEARDVFFYYAKSSETRNGGRAWGESITLFEDGEPILEHAGTNESEGE